MMTSKTIAIVAGEASGDLLAARLIQALRQHDPELQFEGIAGTEMQAVGCRTLYPMALLSVMGFAEVLSRLPALLKIRKALYQRWRNHPPLALIGVDAPDFNLTLEAKLKPLGIPTIHYVSPSVWAWREKRVKKIAQSVDLMLTLFPFELDFYRRHHVRAAFVGHPLADAIELTPTSAAKSQARQRLGLQADVFYLAVLPGSRIGEIQRLAPDFLQALSLLSQKYPDIHFVTPFITEEVERLFLSLKDKYAPELVIEGISRQSRTVMRAADQILLASGTAVLEGMLVGRLMVACYRVAPLTAFIVRTLKMIKVQHYTLPNNLANEALVPELIQEAVTPENIVNAVEQQLDLSSDKKNYCLQRFRELHTQLRCNASTQAARLVMEYLNERQQ